MGTVRPLHCPSEPQERISCCEPPYVPLQHDCVRACLIARTRPVVDPVIRSMHRTARFGLQERYPTRAHKVQDLEMLVEYLHWVFRERTALLLADGVGLTMEEVWEEYGLDCLVKYFSRVHGLDITPWLHDAGVHDPARPPKPGTVLRLPYEVPCEAPTPPEPEPECGTVSGSVEVVEDCDAGTFGLEILIGRTQGFRPALIVVTPSVGTASEHPAIIGTITQTGPFLVGATVNVRITSQDGEQCDRELGDFQSECAVPECGQLLTNVNVVDNCSHGFWNIELTLGPLGGYQIGMVEWTVNSVPAGSVQGVSGAQPLGPFTVGQVVGIIVRHATDPSCDQDLGTFQSECEDPEECPNVDHEVSFLGQCDIGMLVVFITVNSFDPGFIGGTIEWTSVGGGSGFWPLAVGTWPMGFLSGSQSIEVRIKHPTNSVCDQVVFSNPNFACS